MKTNEIRRKWINYFVKNKHLEIPSQSLIPKNDPSLLWINSGVATLKKYFSGKENPPSPRMVNSQRCIRTNDIENVGLTSRHHTFFEMLGNFSIGDYFRKEAINFAFEFLTKELLIPIKKLYVTVYENDKESFEIWVNLGIPKERIAVCKKDRNFWEIGAGPCGPCTEIYYDRGEKYDPNNIGEKLFFEDIENDRYIEIWNIVLSEFENDGQGNYSKLARQNIDTGAGLERFACILQDVPTNYDTDVFVNVRKIIEKNCVKKYDTDLYFKKNKNFTKVFTNKCFSVIIDHLKAVIFALSDGAMPSNKDRGYILRKLLRRTFLYLDYIKFPFEKIGEIIETIIQNNLDYYPYLKDHQANVTQTIKFENKLYLDAITASLKALFEIISKENLDAKKLFKLVDTYGFPIEIIQNLREILLNDLNKENYHLAEELINSINKLDKKIDILKFKIDFDKFDEYFNHHKEISKKTKVASGMEKQNEQIMNLNLDSKFDYHKESVQNSEILKIFDYNLQEVSEIKNQTCYIILKETCFYATSGGQIHDSGTIKNFNVIDVIKTPGGYHLHKVENGTFKLGEKVDGQIDSFKRDILRKQHSSEHLMHSALKRLVSQNIKQEGAFKSFEKISLDFSYNKKLTYQQIIDIEKEIKRIISCKHDSKVLMKTLEEAKEMGAIAYFEDVYKKIKGKLRVLVLCPESIEICGGTHVKNTADIENFMIISIGSKGSGSWRIEAISSNYLVNKFNKEVVQKTKDEFLNYLNEYKTLNIKDDEIEKVSKTNINEIHYLELKDLTEFLRNKINTLKARKEKKEALSKTSDIKRIFADSKEKVNFFSLSDIDRKLLFNSLTEVFNENVENVYLVTNKIDGIIQFVICCHPDLAKKHDLDFNKFAQEINKHLGGKGGGRNYLVQGTIQKYEEKYLKGIVKSINDKIQK
ncbi:MAG: alanine--tRNA ligase [Malacoplasma sp.]|nr:alanine--tRNA ligase [Malacoplasma sp.]